MYGSEINAITSSAFWGHEAFTKCLQSHQHHITQGHRGAYVKRLQLAMPYLLKLAWMDQEYFTEALADQAVRDEIERSPKAFHMDGVYGSDTANAVQLYKTLRWIKSENQRHIDKVVGIMTMKAMEKDMRRIDAMYGPFSRVY